MGYDIHVTRAEFWAENEDCPITKDEWDRVVAADPELQPDPGNPGYTRWNGRSRYPDPWFHWHRGNVTTKNPDRPMVEKMLELARSLHARVQGDDGELYEHASDFPDEA